MIEGNHLKTKFLQFQILVNRKNVKRRLAFFVHFRYIVCWMAHIRHMPKITSLISLNFFSIYGRPHNLKVVGSNPTPATKINSIKSDT